MAPHLPKKQPSKWLSGSMTAGKKRTAKVFVWRILSVAITLVVTLLATGNLAEASGLTVALHVVLMAAHWLFEIGWDRYIA